jgi:hypothetical protein
MPAWRLDTVVLRKTRRHVALPVVDVGDPGGVQPAAFVGHDRISCAVERDDRHRPPPARVRELDPRDERDRSDPVRDTAREQR